MLPGTSPSPPLLLLWSTFQPEVTSVKVVENPGEPSRVMGQAACEVMLSSGSVWAASIRENASTCM